MAYYCAGGRFSGSLIASTGGSVALINWIKNKLELTGSGAKGLTLAVTVVLGLVASIASGALTQEMVQDLPTFVAFLWGLLPVGGTLYGSQWLYKGK